jgi:hypothetical protein
MLTRKIFMKANIGTRKITKNFGQIILHCTIGYSFEEIMLVDRAKFACYVQLTSTTTKKQKKESCIRKNRKEVPVIKLAKKTLYISFRTDFHIHN